MRRAFSVLASFVLVAALVVPAANSQAAVVQALFAGQKDCSGFFGKGDACAIFINSNNQTIILSPVIAKFEDEDNFSLKEAELNTAKYPTINGGEFGITGHDSNSGTFVYTPGADDPALKYWTVKAGEEFLLSWIVSNPVASMCNGGPTNNLNYNLECLKAAQFVAGTQNWITSNGKDISHIAFYDTELPQVVPLPAAVWLFLSALGAFFGFQRWQAARPAA